MLRQGEDEPEDPMGEILVNIGLAMPEDIRQISDTETDDSKIASPEERTTMLRQDVTIHSYNMHRS